MRPLRLEVAGFTAFRELVEIDFEDAPYFALVGPTGSGKSSVIDAMTFALYGCVPRLDARSVHPIISQGKQEARVRLDFAIGDARYTAVRVVRRIGPDRATTKEARLEHGVDVLAGDADGVTEAVEGLLGLSFDQFTRCVVLPQGDFARFMHDKPAARQDLLVRLLGLHVYERMAQRANHLAAKLDGELTIQRRRLEEDLSFANEDDLKATRASIAILEELRARIEDEEPALEALREKVRAAREEARVAKAWTETLARVEVPPDAARLATDLSEAGALLRRLEDAADAADTAAREAEETLGALPARADVEKLIDARHRSDSLELDLRSARIAVADATAAAEAAQKQGEIAERAVAEAARALEAARTEHRAHELARALAPGEPCPVCRQTVADVPELRPLPVVDDAEAAHRAALEAQRRADTAHKKALGEAAAAEARSSALAEQLAVVSAQIASAPKASVLSETLDRIRAAETALAGRRSEASAARANAQKARKAIEQQEASLARARKDLSLARDAVAALGPPTLEQQDLVADWAALEAWARAQVDVQRAAAEAARGRAAEAEAEGRAIVEAQRAACAAADVEVTSTPRDDCIKAAERLRGTESRIEMALEKAKEIAEEIEGMQERATVSRALAGHLKANAFERWVLSHALSTLVQGASDILLQLSNGQYSLDLDKSFNFAVIDHRNANTTRSARTLSGGETFLASLALALALSDRIAQLSATVSVRLESIFLDEGFGTLDPETLETVATAIENLSALNRMVGIVTHVRDLAERVPVRFEVRKGPATATVARVLA